MAATAAPQSTRRAATGRPANPVAALDGAVAAAEANLRGNELHRAESEYRQALFDGWMILGQLNIAAGRLVEAGNAFRQASASAADADAAFQLLALVNLQLGKPAEAVTILTRLAARAPGDSAMQRLLAQALVANGQPAEAIQTLEEAHTASPDDGEVTFALASGYLQAGKIDRASSLFAVLTKAQPGADTEVLIARAYRDYGLYDRARASLERALKLDPRARRAHYYLGTIAMMDGIPRPEDAIKEFRAELTLAPRDPATNLRLGMALVEAERPADALPHLAIAAKSESAPAEAFYFLGRCQLDLNNPAEAIPPLQRALALASRPPADPSRLRSVHYQLAMALRRTGQEAEAAKHFDEAKQASARRTDDNRERLAQYMADAPPSQDAADQLRRVSLDSPFAALSADERAQIERHVKTPMARAYLNLGVMHAQAQRFARAAECFEQAAALDPHFPRVQYSLGVAYFNAQQYDKAAAPLAAAYADDPTNVELRRMLALAWFNGEVYDKAAELLASDPGRDAEPSLQYAYGLALVRSDRAAQAEEIFTRLLTQHGDNAELHVVLGQAHAQQGDFDAAIESLRRALELKPSVAEANATLGTIYLKQGQLAEATTALKAELAGHPDDTRAQHTLATVLDLEGESAEALSILRSVLKTRPDYAAARYLMGKILLAQGAAADAVEQLQAAVRLAPEDAEAHYQLGQAYRQIGQTDLADQEFARFRQIKDKQRGRSK